MIRWEKTMPVQYRCNLCRPNHRVPISNSVTNPLHRPKHFSLWLAESVDAESVAVEGWLIEAGRQVDSAHRAQSTRVSEERWYWRCASIESQLVLS